MNFPPPLIFEPLQLPHRQTFILLHGRGSWAEKFAPELLQTPLPRSSPQNHAGSSQCAKSAHGPTNALPDQKPAMTLQTSFPHARFVFPTAPRRRAALNRRALTHQWFDSWKLDPPATEREELQIEGLRGTALYLHELLRGEIARVPGGARNVVLGGLSQGCAASLVALLLWEGEGLGGVVGMCGRLPFADRIIAEARDEGGYQELGFDPFAADGSDAGDVGHGSEVEDTPVRKAAGWLREQLDLPAPEASSGILPLQKVPIFLGHGAQDEKVSIELGRRAAECLETLGARVCWKEYGDLGHWYSPEMLGDLACFLLETLAVPAQINE
ncbi:hypothetical protein KVR01_004761 [Diaporthe batatas]|uniref:uncharacterized protein n=1 Tax=Diaporthe batatas TaxID=748121 RepID=UPI001D052447|nr:uncharacterized protein KVR01_004761 [Diaporthe batatas]KAG8166209.1 hypothetical protein KVR01_004761 [Diaporthe batatas]